MTRIAVNAGPREESPSARHPTRIHMPMPRALNEEQMKRAAELYLDRKSRTEIAAILRSSEKAVRTALHHMGIPMRDKLQAAAEVNRGRTGFRRKSQLVASVFELAR